MAKTPVRVEIRPGSSSLGELDFMMWQDPWHGYGVHCDLADLPAIAAEIQAYYDAHVND